MVRKQAADSFEPLPPPATTLEGREQQLTAMAYNLAEKRFVEGTASASEVVHFLRAGSTETQRKMEKLEAENEVLKARVKEAESRTDSKELYDKALKAFRGYAGVDPVDPEEGDYGPEVF